MIAMKNKYTLSGLLLLFVFNYSAIAQMADSIRLHIDTCLFTLKQNSLYADRVNWPEVEQEVFTRAGQAKTKAETFEALKIAFDALGDKHAVYYHYDNSYRLGNAALMNRYSDSVKAAWTRGPRIDGQMINGVAYLAVPFMGVNRQEQIDCYANWLYDEVAKLQKQDPKGWIIDLRLDGGGNIRPMLAGLAMFFGEGIVSYYINKDGKTSDEAAFCHGDFLIDGRIQATIKTKIAGLADAKVAVLTGPGTASSGEITAAVFSERFNTLLLGDSTAGLANATNGFVLNDHTTYFLISTASIANQYKIPFPPTIQPGLSIKGKEAFNDISNDAVVKKAIEWLAP